ncbi:unnamed protein product [Nesidiocoris tenuis]|uniref:Secreted protein n=1 Tax=Nesidiocoris tenuis TaxID=355587 RepID=A0A6H5HM90_9HEMI|nr:unnamed protein product [Nesidiocoris tenuis]
MFLSSRMLGLWFVVSIRPAGRDALCCCKLWPPGVLRLECESGVRRDGVTYIIYAKRIWIPYLAGSSLHQVCLREPS